MQLYRFFICVLFLAIFGGPVYSQAPVDPKVIINGGGDPSTCAPNTDIPSSGYPDPTCYSGQNKLSIQFNSPLLSNFIYDGTGPDGAVQPLTTLVLDFTMVPTGTNFTCESDVFSNCQNVTTTDSSTVEFKFFGDPLGMAAACNTPDNFTNTCANQLDAGTEFGLTVAPVFSEVPEPASMILFGTGLCSILVAAKRRVVRPGLA
jgi:hypothetical protein